jgi:hypothetical protein
MGLIHCMVNDLYRDRLDAQRGRVLLGVAPQLVGKTEVKFFKESNLGVNAPHTRDHLAYHA